MSADLIVGIGSDNSDLKKGLKDSEQQITAFLSKIDGIANVGKKLQSIGQSLTAGLTLPILALGAGALKSYADIQALQKGLEAVMGSSQLAGEEFKKLKEVSRLPGLGMEEAVKGSVNLQSIGISADKSRNILSQFGNAVASVGKGSAEFDRAIYGVQQLANTDFPLGEDLNIIKDALPQVSNLLKEAFGTSRSDELAKLGISSKQVLEVITNGLEKLPRVSGGIKGAFENLSDSLKSSLGRIGKLIDDNFNVSGIIERISGFVEKVVSFFEGLSPSIQKAIIIFGGITAAIGPLIAVFGTLLAALPSIISGFGLVSAALAGLLTPIGLVIAGIVGIVVAVTSNWDKIKPYIIDTINYFRSLYNESLIVRVAVQAIVATFKTSFTIVANVLKTAWEIFKSFAKQVADIFGGIGSVIKGALSLNPSEIAVGISKISSAYLSGFKNVGNDIKNGVVGTFNDLKQISKDALSEITKGQKLEPINDIKLFDKKNIEKNTKEEVVSGVTNGLNSANTELKNANLKIQLPEIEPIKTQSVGFSFLGEIFDDFLQYDTKVQEVSDRIINSIASIPVSLSSSSISIRENLSGVQESFTQMSDFGKFLKDAIELSFNSIIDTISNSFSAIGEAMAGGGNIFSAFGNALLSSIGSFLGDLGKQMIQYGMAALAMSVLSKALMNPMTATPAAIGMIAAGAALSLISGAIKGTLKKGSSSGSSSGVISSGSGLSSSNSGSFYSNSANSSVNSSFNNDVVFRISGNDLVGVLSRQLDRNARLNGGK